MGKSVKNDYIVQYKRENYDLIRVWASKGAKKELKAYAEANGLSMSDLITAAVKKMYDIDLKRRFPKQNGEED